MVALTNDSNDASGASGIDSLPDSSSPMPWYLLFTHARDEYSLLAVSFESVGGRRSPTHLSTGIANVSREEVSMLNGWCVARLSSSILTASCVAPTTFFSRRMMLRSDSCSSSIAVFCSMPFSIGFTALESIECRIVVSPKVLV